MPVFETSVDDALGLWTTTPQPQSVSFGLESVSALPDGPLYRVNLPAGPADSAQVFSSSEAAFARMDAALAGVPARLDGLVVKTGENLQKQASAVSFDISTAGQEPGPEDELLLMLADVERNATGLGGGDVSFGLGETASAAWGAASAQFEALIAQIDRDVLHFAWVETTISNRLIARTSVDWSGDAQTVWDAGVNNEQLAQHQRTLRMVTQSRGMRLRLFVTVTSGAVRVASLMATPGGALLALPAVYQYVSTILAQAKELQSIQTL